MFTDDYLQELLSCPKRIIVPPAKKLRVTDKGYNENSFKMIADSGIEFSAFVKQNSTFPENFSVGLLFNSPDIKGFITILRCNGKMEVPILLLTMPNSTYIRQQKKEYKRGGMMKVK